VFVPAQGAATETGDAELSGSPPTHLPKYPESSSTRPGPGIGFFAGIQSFI